jgi:hypothetical protein
MMFAGLGQREAGPLPAEYLGVLSGLENVILITI